MNRRRFLKQGALGAGAMGLREVLGPGALKSRSQTLAAGRVPQDPTDLSLQPVIRADNLQLRQATVVSRPGKLPLAEQAAATVLVEEVEKRTGIRLKTSTIWPANTPVIAITSVKSVPSWGRAIPTRNGQNLPETQPEGYRLYVDSQNQPPAVWVVGADARGTLFGVGSLLRRLDWAPGVLAINPKLDVATAPAYTIRGHQLGYRPTSNTYDAWSAARFDQYIRELTFFGANSIEGIPFQDRRKTPVMKFSRPLMNRAIGEICQRYRLDYCSWVSVGQARRI